MDIFFNDNGDGGNVSLVGGDLKGDGTLFTAVYLSLFGGDSFSNVYETYESDNDFEESLNQPITAKNLKNIETKGKKALEWLIAEGVAESIQVSARGNINEKINVDITIQEPEGIEFSYAVIWQNEKYYLKAI